VQERVTVLSEAVNMLGFLFVAEESFAPEPDSAAKALGPDAEPVLNASLSALEALPEWSAAAIEKALKEALVDGLGLKPRKAFAPVRVAVTGRTVSPPLYESMELLGAERSLARLRRALPAG
jgi:glutamyl-tRNA synthetase